MKADDITMDRISDGLLHANEKLCVLRVEILRLEFFRDCLLRGLTIKEATKKFEELTSK